VEVTTWKTLSKSEKIRLKRLTTLEKQAREKGYSCVAGVDEAGRGPLAGPVFAAACIIPEGIFFPGINDSKLLSPIKRKNLFELITSHPKVSFGVCFVDHERIDQINIHQASLEAMSGAISQLPCKPDYVLVDGLKLTLADMITEKVIHGDRLSQMIAAASIVAKQSRDQVMTRYHEQYPQYGFDEHKGYATPEHRAALVKYGPCPIHRRTFAPVSELLLLN